MSNYSYTYQPSYTWNDTGFFGAVDVKLGTRHIDTRIVRIKRPTRSAALNDAHRLASDMTVNGKNCAININDYL